MASSLAPSDRAPTLGLTGEMTRSPALLLLLPPLLLGALPSAEAARGESWRPVWRSGLCSAAPFPPALNPATVLAWHTPPVYVCPIAAGRQPPTRFPSFTRSYRRFHMPPSHSLGLPGSHSGTLNSHSLSDTSPKEPQNHLTLSLPRSFPGHDHNLAHTHFQVHI